MIGQRCAMKVCITMLCCTGSVHQSILLLVFLSQLYYNIKYVKSQIMFSPAQLHLENEHCALKNVWLESSADLNEK